MIDLVSFKKTQNILQENISIQIDCEGCSNFAKEKTLGDHVMLHDNIIPK